MDKAARDGASWNEQDKIDNTANSFCSAVKGRVEFKILVNSNCSKIG
jgi:hypothetical protein